MRSSSSHYRQASRTMDDLKKEKTSLEITLAEVRAELREEKAAKQNLEAKHRSEKLKLQEKLGEKTESLCVSEEAKKLL